jgi:hypothetical protein
VTAAIVPLDAHREVEDIELVCITPGEYDVVYVRHAGITVFRTPKVRIDFRLLAHPGLVLSRWYRVQDYRGGRVRAGRHSDIVRELSAVLGHRLRHDRIPATSLAGKVIRVRVCTVTTDSRQGGLAAMNRYSVIDRLLECAQ